MEQQENLRVIFTDKAELVFTDILKKYGFQESPEEIFGKLEADKLPKEIMARRIIEAFADQVVTKEDFSNAIKKVFRVDRQTAKKVSKDIVRRRLSHY